MWAIVFNTARNHRRGLNRRNQRVTELTHDVPAPSAESDDVEVVRQAIRELPDRQRTMVFLRHYGGLGYDEIAQVVGMTPGTAASLTVSLPTASMSPMHWSNRQRLATSAEMTSLRIDGDRVIITLSSSALGRLRSARSLALATTETGGGLSIAEGSIHLEGDTLVLGLPTRIAAETLVYSNGQPGVGATVDISSVARYGSPPDEVGTPFTPPGPFRDPEFIARTANGGVTFDGTPQSVRQPFSNVSLVRMHEMEALSRAQTSTLPTPGAATMTTSLANP